jgi:Ca2+/Na+ antiporter
LKRFSVAALLSLCAIASAIPLARRWQEEKADRRVLVTAEWIEARALSAREALSDLEILARLRTSGASAVLFAPLTLWERVTGRPNDAAPWNGSNALDSKTITFKTAEEAQRVYAELQRRGVGDLALAGRELRRSRQTFLSIAQIETGFDERLLRQAASEGLFPILRFNQDPWLTASTVREVLSEDPWSGTITALMNSEEPPGGKEAAPLWGRWLRHKGVVHPYFEFRPAKAAAYVAWQAPANTVRAHTIPGPELKDLDANAEAARWRRAVDERSCRILLVHAGPNDGFHHLLGRIERLSEELTRRDWRLTRPWPHLMWQRLPGIVQKLLGWIALALAISFPWLALWGGLAVAKSQSSPVASAALGFAFMSLVLMIGGSAVAALAQSPETRIQVIPFRGIKASFLMSWLGAIFILYSPRELAALLKESVRRWDVVAAVVLLGLVGYVLIRTGNASAGWKHPLEQALRDRLEDFLVARPRFKEFGFGHPLLVVGLALEAARRLSKRFIDGRPLIWLGMVGQASVINTFCHLHSPLRLAYWRSLTGMILGLALGLLCFAGARRILNQRTP